MGYKPSPLESEQRARIASLLDGHRPALLAAQSEEHALTPDEAVASALKECN